VPNSKGNGNPTAAVCTTQAVKLQIYIIAVLDIQRQRYLHTTLTELGMDYITFEVHAIVSAVVIRLCGRCARSCGRLSVSSFVLVYKNLVRSHLDYCNCVWSPYRKSDVESLEKVQKKATK